MGHLSIRTKLMLGYMVAFALFVVLGAAVIYPIIERSIVASIESELNNTTKTILEMVRTSADASIKNYLRAVAEKNRDIVDQFYRQYLDGELTEEEAKARAISVLESQRIGETGYIYCLDSKGTIQVHPVPSMIGADLTKYSFINEQLKRREGYIEYEWKNPGDTEPHPKALYMTYFEPWDWIISVSSYRREFTRLVNIDNFRDSILSIHFGKTGYPYIINGSGEMIAHHVLKGNMYNVKDSKGKEFVREICEKKNGKLFYTWRNPGETEYREKLVIFNYIPEFDWIVISSSYVEEFYEPLTTIRNALLAVCIPSLGFLFVLSFAYASYIVRNLNRLVQNFKEGSSGNYALRMPEGSSDEFGRLSRHFNHFMERLTTYHRSLQQEILERKSAEKALNKVHDELELRVKERTAELAHANEQMCAEIAERQKAEEARAKMLVEREALEGQLHQAQKLEAIGQLAAGIAHEINTPMQFINDNTSFIQRSFADINKMFAAYRELYRGVESQRLMPELLAQANNVIQSTDSEYLLSEIPQALTETREGIDRVTTIVRAMKEFSHPGTSHKTAADLNSAIESTVTLTRNEWKVVADVKFDLDQALPLVTCFVGEFNQAMLNLIVNAVHAIDDTVKNTGVKGLITISTRQDGADVEVRVSDTGSGIPESIRHRIFEPFFTTKGVGKGTGQGLSVVYGTIVKRHGGTVTFETEINKGTTFIVRMPIKAEVENSDPAYN